MDVREGNWNVRYAVKKGTVGIKIGINSKLVCILRSVLSQKNAKLKNDSGKFKVVSEATWKCDELAHLKIILLLSMPSRVDGQ